MHHFNGSGPEVVTFLYKTRTLKVVGSRWSIQ